MRITRKTCAIAVAAAMALSVTACGGDDTPAASAPPTGPVTLTWWHNGTTDPLNTLWQQLADEYHSTHPDVSFKIEPIQNEQFPTKVPLALQSSTPPDIYQQWGGGQEAGQITSGKVADLSSVAPWAEQLGLAAPGWQVDGKQYGVPFIQHVVGFWYRKDLFTQAGVTTAPTTMDELTTAITKLKAAGLAPIAVGGKDRWPDAFYWGYFATRECSTAVLKEVSKTVKLDDPCWTKAGTDLKNFLALNPFQPGFVGTPAQQGAGSSAGMVANGQAAMELQGDWEPGTMSALTTDKDLKSKLGWFPFPAVAGGAGDPGVVLGGGDGFSCTTRAAAACGEFLKYLVSTPVQNKLAASGSGLPVNPASASALTDNTLKTVFDQGHKAAYIQSYFDVAWPTAVGQALNDAVANFFAGQGTPESIVQAVNQAAAGNK
jgi:raffinose/stachyose/melibiose transport system substrate-binding protein